MAACADAVKWLAAVMGECSLGVITEFGANARRFSDLNRWRELVRKGVDAFERQD